MTDIIDGESQTILVVEVNQESVNWLAPNDITAAQFRSLFRDDSEFNHTGVTIFGLADGSATVLSRNAKDNVLNALLTNASNDQRDLEFD